MKAYRNLNQILTLSSAFKKDGRRLKEDDLSIIENASVVFDKDKILWVGCENDFPKKYENVETKNLAGHVLTPEIVDPHTHLIFGGDRAKEYAMRLNGHTYEEIAKAGGGILNSMKGTNELSEDELFELSKERIERLYSYGIGTIEIKSGYGLNYDKEYELSKTIDRLKKHFWPQIQIKNTYLAAHAVPKEFDNSRSYMVEVVFPLLGKLAEDEVLDAVDIFHEKNYFDEEDTKAIFAVAEKLGIDFKVHADELNDNGGAKLAAEKGALSADHLLLASDEGIDALAKSDIVATLLPGTAFFLGKPQAPARKFLDKGVRVALASDYNPGSCHVDNLLMIAAMAAPQYGMNQAELWSAITINSAYALGLKKQGAIIKDLAPRFSVFNTKSIDHITYHWGRNFSVKV